MGAQAEEWAIGRKAYALDIADWIFDRLDLSPDAQLLDAGCGAGGSVLKACARGAKVTGTDVAAEMLAICRRRPSRYRSSRRIPDLCRFADHTFDSMLTCTHCNSRKIPCGHCTSFSACRNRARSLASRCLVILHTRILPCWEPPCGNCFNPPSFEGPFSLSPPAKLHDVIAQAGLNVLEYEDFDRTREFTNFDEFWRTQSGTGTTRFSIAQLGEQPVRKAMASAVAKFTDANRRITLTNRFHAVICRKSN